MSSKDCDPLFIIGSKLRRWSVCYLLCSI